MPPATWNAGPIKAAASRTDCYEAVLGSEVAGHAEFVLRPPARIVFTHTVTEPGFTGRGNATRLVGWALSDARDRELRIVARCPFITSCLETHRQYDDTVEGRSPTK